MSIQERSGDARIQNSACGESHCCRRTNVTQKKGDRSLRMQRAWLFGTYKNASNSPPNCSRQIPCSTHHELRGCDRWLSYDISSVDVPGIVPQ